MGYIYYIWLPNTKTINLSSGAGSYIGQGSTKLDNGRPYGRMLEHLQIAYGQKKGPFYGSEKLIRDATASGVMFGVYDDVNYGILPKIYDEMRAEGWEIEDETQKLDAAEILHIISHNGDLSSGNIATGGQGNLVWKLDDSSWVTRFENEFALTKKDYSTANLNEVRLYWHDSKDVALKKLFSPEKFLVLRACSFAIQKNILNNIPFLEEIVLEYFKTKKLNNTKIKQQINKITQTINTKIFKETKVSTIDNNNLIKLTTDKLVKWIDERIKIKTINDLMNIFNKDFGKITSYTVHGVPGFKKEDTSNKIVYHKTFDIKRTDLVQYIPTKKPLWYTILMQNVPGIPVNHTSGRQGSDESGLNRIVSECIYDIFKHYLSIATKSLGNTKPSVTLRERLQELYQDNGIKLFNFSRFYEIAITKWRLEKNRYLLEGEYNTNTDRYKVTFQQDFSDNSWTYEWSEEYINKVESLEQNNIIIPSYLW